MYKNHPTLEDFEGLLHASRPNRHRNARIVRHLLAACSACCDQLRIMGWPANRLTRLVHLPGGSQDLETEASFARALHDYDEAFARADQAVSEFLAVPPMPSEDAKDLLAELTRQPLERQEDLLQSESRFASPQLVRELIERSHGTRYEDPEAMVHWANLAKTAALCCTAQATGNPARLADLQARAWGQFGNSLRVAGRLREAEKALASAQEALQAGTGDPALRARLLEQTASLHTFNRAFNAAIEILAEAAEIYSDLGESHSLARTLVQEAIACL
ncbi:MAG TPA: hypothetical protein VOA87_14760, partial [Thermoanaerobaculia bacterium]|nr:hypothetical protein [Thermoanaerobaculia bacterium]